MIDSKKGQTSVYFENLNAIRFIAASMVIICHIEAYKLIGGFPNNFNLVHPLGDSGVALFFVLSGFLISYLLYKEKEETKTINVKNFYIRRILRIWPLYFLIISLGFFVFPFIGLAGNHSDHLWDHMFYKILLAVLFLSNVLINLNQVTPYIAQVWSIGVEEQFYLVWPVLNKYFKSKWLVILGFLLFFIFIKVIFYFTFPSKGIMNTTRWPFDCMAIGATFALIIFENTALTIFLRKVIFSRTVQILTLAAIGASMFLRFYPSFANDYYSMLFGILICNLAANRNRLFSLENAVSNYLGKISYGLYMFHPVAIAFCLNLLFHFNLLNNYILYPLSFVTTILVSSLSYYFFEKRFIKLKVRYSDIISGDNARVPQ